MANCVAEWVAEQALRYAPDRGPDVGGQIVRDAIAKKKYEPYRDLRLQLTAESLLGRHSWESKLKAWGQRSGWVREAATEAVDLSLFRSVIAANVSAVMAAAYTDAVSVSDRLVGKEPDEAGMDPLAPSRVPMPAVATDLPRSVAPATEYPRTGFSPFYITAPIPDKVGLIAVLTLELVKANQTRRFLDASAEVARVVALHQIKQRLRVVLGITNNYSRNGTSYNTFLTSGDRVNKLTDFTIANGPAELDRLAQLFNGMTNPFTGEPMDVQPTTILTTMGNLFNLKSMVGTRTVRVTTGASEMETTVPDTFEFSGEILTDRYVYNLLVAEGGLTTTQAATWVEFGDFQRAFKEREVEPFHTFEVGPDDEAWPPHFFQDIVYATKARYWSVAYVADPFAVAAAYKT